MPSIFLDSGYLVALALTHDQHHVDTVNHWQRVLQGNLQIVTTSLVLVEAVTFINSRGYHHKAVLVGSTLLENPHIQMNHVDESLLMEGWEYFKRHSDKRYSLTDCVSFVIMERHRIRTAYTFDRNFTQAGFIIEPMRF